jgi:hypothetical protein
MGSTVTEKGAAPPVVRLAAMLVSAPVPGVMRKAETSPEILFAV